MASPHPRDQSEFVRVCEKCVNVTERASFSRSRPTAPSKQRNCKRAIM